MNSSRTTLGAGLGLIAPACAGAFATGVPTLICPLPLTIMPAFFLASLSPALTYAAVAVPSVLFFTWNPHLFRGEPRLSIRSLILLAATTVCTAWWLVVGWRYGFKYQGAGYTYGICIMNTIWLAVLWVLYFRARRSPSFARNLQFSWLLFAWLAWYAFPYLGELP